ncbi:MAG: DUF2808 domain-containing protein [Iphinoe sp. HA4291-MV1]|nr:DUF2808 domain-containing protein [Iphinoe sp. HA4291-MV1]
MKKLILSVVPLLLISSAIVPPTNAATFRRDTKATYIVRSGALSTYTNAANATHYFDLQVQGLPLSHLFIDLPNELTLTKGISITNQSGEKVSGEVTVKDKRAAIAFTEPVTAGTTLKVALQGVRTTYPLIPVSQTWLYPIYGRSVGLTTDIPFGLVRIQTYGAS